MSQPRIYRLTHPLRPGTSTCVLSNRDDLVDLACYILVKAGRDYDCTPHAVLIGFNAMGHTYPLLKNLLTVLDKPLVLKHLDHALHHIESLALAYCNQHYLDEPLALQTDSDIDLWNPALLNALERCQQDQQASEDSLLQGLIELTQGISRIGFVKETCFLPFLMLVYSNHKHLARVLESMKTALPAADPGNDTSVIEVDLQQALEARKVWRLSPDEENPLCTNPAYDALLQNESVAILMDDECWMAEWRRSDSQAEHAIYGPDQPTGAALHRLCGKL